MNLRVLLVVVVLTWLKQSYSTRLLRPTVEEVDKCPDHHITTVHNTMNCVCDTTEGLVRDIADLRVICREWTADFFEKPCDSFRVNGKVDKEAMRRSLANVHRKSLRWDREDINIHKSLLRSLDVNAQKNLVRPTLAPFPGFPLPSPDPKNCRYHCQCCYMCGFPCYEPSCGCNQYICRRTCRPLTHFCPLLV